MKNVSILEIEVQPVASLFADAAQAPLTVPDVAE